jgi:Putative zinc-finger
MKCEECQPLLDLYFDGELNPSTAATVEAHLNLCASCSGAYQSLREEHALFLSYECDAAPAPEFWDDVLSKARAEKAAGTGRRAAGFRASIGAALSALSVPRFSPALTAAMLLAAVGLTAALMSFYRSGVKAPEPAVLTREAADSTALPNPPAVVEVPRPEVSDDKNTTAPGPLAVGPSRVVKVRSAKSDTTDAATTGTRRAPSANQDEAEPERLVREAERKYLAAIAILSRDAGRRRPRMNPEALARFDRTLAVIDRAIAETRGAARENPRDPVAVQYMLAAYARKVDVLRGLAQD